MDTEKACANCKFSHLEGEERYCHYNPPLAMPAGSKHPITGQVSMGVVSFYPPVRGKVPCSKHQYLPLEGLPQGNG